VLFLTARSDEVDKLLGLEMGADDYVAKPFSPREVCARVRTFCGGCKIRRAFTTRIGQFELNEPAANQLVRRSLAPDPLRIPAAQNLVAGAGARFSRQQLMDKVWGDDGDSFDRTVDTHIKTLRAKLRAVNELSPISTHRGMGYSLGLY
jgi:two-component system catabolic regulation response regulator CreB